MSVYSLVSKHGVEITILRPTRTQDATGATVEAWSSSSVARGLVVLRGGHNVTGGSDAHVGGKETRKQSATIYFKGVPDVKFSDRLQWADPVRAGVTYTFEIRNVVSPQYRPASDELQYTSVRAEEVRQP